MLPNSPFQRQALLWCLPWLGSPKSSKQEVRVRQPMSVQHRLLTSMDMPHHRGAYYILASCHCLYVLSTASAPCSSFLRTCT